MLVHGHVTLNIIDDPEECKAAPFGKPFLRMTFPDGMVQNITTNLGEMIGGASAGARKRWEDKFNVGKKH